MNLKEQNERENSYWKAPKRERELLLHRMRNKIFGDGAVLF